MYSRTSIVLGVVAVLLAGLAWLAARPPAQRFTPIVPIESSVSELADGVALAALDKYAPPPLATLTETVERPLFNSTRRVEEVPDEPQQPMVAPVVVSLKPPALSLTAVVIDGVDRVAVVRLAAKGAFERLREGDEVEGWTVERISSQGLRLVQGDSAHEIELRSFESVPATGVPGRAPARAAGNANRTAAPQPRPRRTPRSARLRSRASRQ